MFKRKIKAKTCFLMGVVAGALYAISGLLVLLGQSSATFLYLSGLAFTGAMILFTATTQAGPDNKSRRWQLLGLFFLLLVSYPNLPPLSTLAGALVLPLFLRMYLPGRGVFAGLLAVELVYFAVQTLALVNELALGLVPVLLVALGVARALAAWWLYRTEAAKPEDPGERLAKP